MPVPTGDDAVERYQTQVPFLRSNFEKALTEVRRDYERREQLFTNRYQAAVVRLAEEEVGKRAEIATKSLKDAIDGGWRPAEDELRNTYIACFNPNHYEKDSRSDIEAAISEFTDKLGRPITPEVQKQYGLQIGHAQVNATERSLAELKMYLRGKGPTTKVAEVNAVASKSGIDVKETPATQQVFISHGRDDYAKGAVERFIYDVGLKPIVLEDEPNVGMTVIEKYEKHAAAAYGIAILSPDDVGCLKDHAPDALMARARQNVIFELGYMFARIGRNRVAVLLPDLSVEKPSNIEGIVWIAFDSGGGWKPKLRKELLAAGFQLRD